DRLVYQARLRSRYGRGWRRKAPVEAMMPLRLARYGVPLTETVPAGLAAAGIDPAREPAPVPVRAEAHTEARPELDTTAAREHPEPVEPAQAVDPVPNAETAPAITVPVAPGRSRPLGGAGSPLPYAEPVAPEPEPVYDAPEPPFEALPEGLSRDEQFYVAFRSYMAEKDGTFPDPHQFARYLLNTYNVTGKDGTGPLSENYLRTYVREFRQRFRMEMESEHIA
ncbi:hypothetical protein AB0I82_36115, partial [Streptomyces sp. NPDC050315]